MNRPRDAIRPDHPTSSGDSPRPRGVRVKICGVTDEEGLEAAVEAGADAVGFVLSASPRRLEVARAAELAARLPPFVSRVAVFRLPTEEELRRTMTTLAPDLVQCEPGSALERADIPVLRRLAVLHDGPALEGAAARLPRIALLEAPGRGGRGRAPDWARAARLARRTRLVLAGGLRPENVADAIRRVRPWAVDVSSGVERAPGRKDPGLVRSFVRAAREAAAELDAEMDG